MSLTLRVITPDQIALDEPVDAVSLPGLDGSLGVLSRHAPMVAALDVGLVRYKQGGSEKVVFVSGGFADVASNTVRVLAPSGEAPGTIDRARAEEARDRALARLEGRGDEEKGHLDLTRARASMLRALARIRATEFR